MPSRVARALARGSALPGLGPEELGNQQVAGRVAGPCACQPPGPRCTARTRAEEGPRSCKERPRVEGGLGVAAGLGGNMVT